MTTEIIPRSYEEWRHCIEVICKQKLTKRYIDQRIAALNNVNDYMTNRFVQLYGEPQRIQTLEWFEREKELMY